MLNGPDEVLIRQKDFILQELNKCLTHNDDHCCMMIEDYDNILHVVNKLLLVQELWCDNNYKYKGREIVDRILAAARDSAFYLHKRATKKKAIAEKVIVECNLLRIRF